MTWRRPPTPWLLVLAMVGCASTKPTAASNDVADAIAQRSGLADVIDSDPEQRGGERVRERVAQLLAEPLTLDRALEVAMLNNRGLLATLENLGVAQADLVQAGLLDNPVVGGDLVVSTVGNGFGGGLALSQSLLSAFLIPAQRRLAKARLQVAVVQVTDAALALVRDVKVAHAELLGSMASCDIHRTLVQTAEVADELAQRQRDAGNLAEIDRELFASALDEARLDLAEHELHIVEARERFNRLLGLWGDQVDWVPAGSLAEPSPTEAPLDDLEQAGVGQRLDISAARYQVESMERALELRRRGVVPAIEAGVEARNEVGDDLGHEWVVGPSLSIELPLFDPGHADFARLRAQLRQAQHQLQQTAINARSHIRVHRQRLITARRRVDYMRDVVLPRRQTITARALERYNGMLIGAYDLFDIRAEEVMAQQHYVEALRDYWVARAELERAVGGRLPTAG
ncbi:MAG: TolC family protein [Deltaproteobacteria bacterium]|nr:TolC family protein [Deltaproteobacteria bacterium]